MTLHWFVHPRWFDLVGGFTKAENIKYFLDWAKLAFENFGEAGRPRHTASSAASSSSGRAFAQELGLLNGYDGASCTGAEHQVVEYSAV